MVINSTTDIVNALVSKGVLTEEEGALLTKGRTDEAAGQAKALKKAGKVTVSDAIENATFYGDVRVRGEHRSGDGVGATTATADVYNASVVDAAPTIKTLAVAAVAKPGVSVNRDRARYKLTFGVKTTSGAFDTDLAFAMGAAGRSDNATFGASASSSAPFNNKDALYVKRAKVSFKATDWLTVDAGRFDNPLYITPMVWDADLTVEGLSEQANFKANDSNDIFLTAVQNIYSGDRKLTGGVPQTTSGIATGTSMQYAFQAGIKSAFNDRTSAKAAITYSTVTKNPYTTKFGTGSVAAGSGGTGLFGANDLDIIDVPAEINYMVASNVGVKLFGDYAVNTSADDRAKGSAITAAANGSSGSDDTAWMLGVAVGSAKDLKAFESAKMVKGDWSARLWYQDVGIWSLDAAQVDSDIFDSRVNIKGTTFKAQYNFEDAVALNFAAAHGKKKNTNFYALGSGDMSGDIKDLDLIQVDLTYKF